MKVIESVKATEQNSDDKDALEVKQKQHPKSEQQSCDAKPNPLNEVARTTNWTSLSVEERKSLHKKLHAQLRAMINSTCLPNPDRIGTDNNEKYRELFQA